ncbi:MAG: hypothetical protein U0Q22_15560 [Acidimicrobiales bacterium]
MARPKVYPGERLAKVIRLDPKLAERVQHVADERQVSFNLVATWALEDFVRTAPSIQRLRRPSADDGLAVRQD